MQYNRGKYESTFNRSFYSAEKGSTVLSCKEENNKFLKYKEAVHNESIYGQRFFIKYRDRDTSAITVF